MFLISHGLNYSRFGRLKEYYQNQGIATRIYGNTNGLPENTLSQVTIERVRTFLLNYVEENAISHPGGIPGFKSDDINVLPSYVTKLSIWRVHTASCETSGVRTVEPVLHSCSCHEAKD